MTQRDSRSSAPHQATPQLDSPTGPLAGRSITVVGINYAPEPTGSAPYTAGLAEMLVEHGARVDVIAGVPHYPTWKVDPAYKWRPRTHETLNGVRVHRMRHFVPGRQSAISRLLWEGTFLANAALAAPSRRPDLVIASTPSLSGAVIAARLARRNRVPLGIVVQDLVGQAAKQSGISGGGTVAEAAAKVESRALRQAAGVAVVSDSFRRQLGEYGVDDARVRLLPNWTHIAPPTRPRAEVRAELGWDDDTFVVLHTGNMGLKQDLGNVVEAARELAGRADAAAVRIVLMGDGNQRAALEEQGAGVAGLSFLPPASGEDYPEILRAADLLLVNERPTVGEMSLPSKLTSYFAAGRPVLAAVSADGACARELTRADGAGRRVEPGSPALLADAVIELSRDRQHLDDMGARAVAYADATLGRAAAAENVLTFALDLLSTRSLLTGSPA